MIQGTVSEGTTGRRVGDVLVSLTLVTATPSRPLALARQSITDGEGRFAFQGVEPGKYNLSVRKAGYLSGGYGVRRPGGLGWPVVLSAGETTRDISLTIWNGAVIAGIVRGEAGEPQAAVGVKLLRRSFVGLGWTLVAAGDAATDDRGEYRAGSLVPGHYLACVFPLQASWPLAMMTVEKRSALIGVMGELDHRLGSGRNQLVGDVVVQTRSGSPLPLGLSEGGRLIGYRSACQPQQLSGADPVLIEVKPGEVRDGADIQLTAAVTPRVSGVLTSAFGAVSDAVVRLVPEGMSWAERELEVDVARTITDVDGRFTLMGAPPGAYVVKVLTGSGTRGAPGASTAAEQSLIVGESDQAGVVVRTNATRWVAGRVGSDSGEPIPGDAISEMRMMARSVGRLRPTRIVGVGSDGTFSFGALPEGEYLICGTGAQDWAPAGETFEGRDLCGVPAVVRDRDYDGIVVTMTRRGGALRGVVLGDDGRPDSAASVVAFPAAAAQSAELGALSRQVRLARVSQSGAYSLTGLPPGDYHVAAVPDEAAVDWPEAGFLAALARRAPVVSLMSGARRTLDLTMTRRLR